MGCDAPRIAFARAWSLLGWLLIAALAVIAVIRFRYGLGAVTNLADSFPWGLWVGFKLCCVALAAGGFTLTATVYVLHRERYRPIVRPAVLTAFLGYSLFIASLVFDLGKPWNIWRPIVHWNPRSVMFEVAWCVMLYTSVLILEFSPVLLERFRFLRHLALVKKVMPALVIVGIILSTLHQSSLGSLYLIMPEKMHPLWYSPLLPLLFFLSSLAAGLAMIVAESWFAQKVLARSIEAELLADLARASVAILALYLAVRLGDLHARGALAAILSLSWPALFFLVELGVGTVLPLGLLALRRVRQSPRSLALSQGFVILGLILNRLNVAITAYAAQMRSHYIPSVAEILISLGLVALGLKAFFFLVRRLPVFPTGTVQSDSALSEGSK